MTLLIFLCLSIIKVECQSIENGCNAASFGVDADQYANSNSFGQNANDNNYSDDWFFNPAVSNGLGIGVIDVSNAENLQQSLQSGDNLSLIYDMSIPFNTVHQGVRLLDAIYGRDFYGGTQNTDYTSYIQASKNGEDPAIWDTGPANVTPKNDLIDCFAHLRRDGINGDDDLWLFGGFSRISNIGSSYLDMELYSKDIQYTPSSGFTSAGNDEGHTAWTFDSNGNLTRTGDIVVSYNFSTNGAPEIELRIWVAQSDFQNTSPTTFSFGSEFDGGTNNSNFGYADILPPNNGIYSCGLGNPSTTFAPPWGTLNSNGNYSYNYEGGQFAEFGLNLNAFGIDPSVVLSSGAGISCDIPFSAVLFKARASQSFTAQLKDFAGPYPFEIPLTIPSDIVGDTIDCINAAVTLGPEIVIPDASYIWSTSDGNIIGTTDSAYILVDQPGTYSLDASSAPGCLVNTSSFYVPELYNYPTADIQADTIFDCGVSASLTAWPAGHVYEWSGPFNFQSDQQQISVQDEGMYIVSVMDPISQCMALDSIYLPGGPCQNIDLSELPGDGNQVIIIDNEPPMVNWPDDITLSCLDDFLNLSLTGTLGQITDNCPENLPAPFYLDLSSNGICLGEVVYNRLWYVTDFCGNLASHSQVITLVDTIPPFFIAPNDVTIDCSIDVNDLGDLGDATGEYDDCDFSIGEAFYQDSIASGVSCTGNDVIYRVWTLVDGCGNENIQIQTINFADSEAPTFTVPNNITISCSDDANDLGLTGTIEDTLDNCSNTLLTINYWDQIVVDSNCVSNYLIYRSWLVTDGCGNDSLAIQEITIEDIAAPTFTAPEDITVACDVAESDLITLGDVINEYDDCTASIANATYTDVIIASGPCPSTKTIERTWSLSDDCGNITSIIQLIEFEDTSNPTFTVPEDVTIECHEDPANLLLTGNVFDEADNCSENGLEATYIDDVTSGIPCNGSTIIQRTWTLVDDCGNTSSAIQQITLEDNTPPSFSMVAVDPQVSCDVVIPTPQIGVDLFITDACDTSLNISFYEEQTNITCPDVYVLRRVWIAEDNCGNIDSLVQEIMVEDSGDPIILVFPPDLTVSCDSIIPPGGAVVDDNCSSSITVNVNDSIVDGSCDFNYAIIRIWSWEDDCGNVNTAEQTITVVDENSPNFIPPSDTLIGCDANLSDINQTGSILNPIDNCDPTVLNTTYRDSVLNGYPCEGSQRIIRIWMVSDTCGNENEHVQVIDMIDTVSPTWTLPSDITITCETDLADLSITGNVVSIDDNCDTSLDLPTYTDSIVQDTSCLNSSIIYRNWSVSDACGNTISGIQTIVISDTIAPSFTVPSDITLDCSENVNDLNLTGFVIDESDNCQSIIGDPIYMDSVVVDQSCSGNSVIYRNWILEDACGNSIRQVQLIVIQDTIAPTFITPNDVTLDCSEDITDLSITGSVTAVLDNCSPFSIVSSHRDSLVANAGCEGQFTVIRIWTVQDMCGNSSEAWQHIYLVDNTPPFFVVPPDITLDCDADVSNVTLTGFPDSSLVDNCSSLNLNISYVDLIRDLGKCGATRNVVRTWLAVDDCGNQFSAIQNISLIDTIAPVFIAPPTIVISCTDDPSDLTITGEVDTMQIAEACGINDVTIYYVDSISLLNNCSSNYELLRTWYLIDDCDNQSSAVQVISIEDQIGPTFSAPDDITIDCDLDINELIITGVPDSIQDECSINFSTPTYRDSIVDQGSCIVEVIYRTWEVVDECGNISREIQTITLQDTIQPVFFSPADTTLHCSQDPLDFSITGLPFMPDDNCDNNLGQIMFSDSLVVSDSCAIHRALYRTWSLSDQCNNLASYLQIIYLLDTLGPSFTVPQDVTLNCEENLDNLSITGNVANEFFNCENQVGLTTYQDSLVVSSNCNEIIVHRLWNLSNNCGWDTSQVQLITLIDTLAPTFINQPADLTLSCGQALPVFTPNVIDACSSNPIILSSLDTLAGDCFNEINIVRTWMATDSCENADSIQQQILVEGCAPDLELVMPSSLTECFGAEVTMQVNIQAQVSSIFFQWQVFLNGQWTNIDGADQAIFTIASAETSDEGVYRCIAAGQLLDIGNEDCQIISPEIDLSITSLPIPVISYLTFCEGDTIIINNLIITTPGTFLDTINIQNGCDSLIQLEIEMLLPTSSQEFINICEGDSVNYNGNWYSQPTSFYDTLTNVSGCDSIHAINIEVGQYTTEERLVQVCLGDSLFAGGAWHSDPGVFLDTINGSSGCDTILSTTLSFVNYIENSITSNLCSGDTIIWNGNLIYSAGVWRDTILNALGCDTIYIHNVVEIPIVNTNENYILCEGDSVFVAGNWRYENGFFVETFSGSSRCDSIVNSTVVFNPSYSFQDTVLLCFGDSIAIDGQIITTAGSYANSMTSVNGCDSIINYVVEFNLLDTIELVEQICSGQFFNFNGTELSIAGDYQEIFQNQYGCDSIVNLTLVVEDDIEVELEYLICPGDSVEINGSWYFANSDLFFADLAQNGGCDSLTNVSVILAEVYQDTSRYQICQGDSISLFGNFYAVPTEIIETSQSVDGCDSNIVHILEIIDVTQLIVDDAYICRGEGVELFVEGAVEVEWSPSTGLSCTNCLNPIASPNQSTTYTVSSSSCLGESVEQEITVYVYELPTVSILGNANVTPGDTLELTYEVSDTTAQLMWLDAQGDTLCNDNCPDTLFVIADYNSIYTIAAIDEDGCRAEDEIVVRINDKCEDAKLFFPNFITPNGDGKNDEYVVTYEDVKSIALLRIFNRWGELIFETYDVDNDHWDGTFRGVPVNVGVYVYYLEGVCLNNVDFIEKGNITIIR